LEVIPTGYPYIRVSDFNNYGSINLQDIHYINEEVHNSIKKYIITTDDVYISIAGTIGKSGIIPQELNGANLTENACRLVFIKGIYNRYIYYHTLSPSFVEQISKLTKTTTQPKLALTRLATIKLNIPPLAEQKRIVEILDREFERIDALKANAEQNLQHAKDLFQSALKQELQPKEEWETKTIGEICTLKSGNSNANNTPEGTLPFVKVGDMNIQGNEERITCSSNYVSYTANIKGIFPIGTVIFPKRGGAILTNKKRITSVEICCDLNIMGVYSNGAIIPELLYFYFLGVDLSKIYNGAAIPQINNGDIAPLTISFPKILTEQHSVVNRLIKHREICKALEDNYKKTIALCDDMKQALLRKAFNGEL
jgi:type I restriction enzyme S subunit